VDTEAAVEVYCVKDRIVANAMAWWADMGVWGATKAVESVQSGAPDTEIGEAVARLLVMSRSTAVDPGRDATQILLRAAGVRSHPALVKQARFVFVRREANGSTVTLLPSARAAEGGGWITARAEDGIVLLGPTPASLGAALRVAIEMSR
jgi:hypothetical protein